MEPLRLKPRQPVADEIENWDDDDFLINEVEDLGFRSNSALQKSHRRDSQSSHLSRRSDLESIQGEEKQVHLPGDDEKSTLDAIAAATKAGIPIPQNVPSSALMGGTIKRLGGRKIKKIIQEDWDDDLELPEPGKALRIKPQDSSKFPEVLRQVSGSAQASPLKLTKPSPISVHEDKRPAQPNPFSSSINLDRFKDTEDDEDLFGDGVATIKVSKTRQTHKPISLITPPTPQKKAEDDFENDFELPSDGKLKLSSRKDIPKTPSLHSVDDFDWGEGSLGTRFGGTRRDGRSNRSSSASALSPSVSSSITAESEDETFDGLVLPNGPVNFGARLQQQKQTQPRSPERPVGQQAASTPKPAPVAEADRDDFLQGLDIGDGEVFDSGKLTLHRNLKLKDTRPASPARPKTAVSLTFTNKPAGGSRLPRPLTHERNHHERTHTQTSLEPVSESGGPILPKNRRPQSRLGHSAQSSVSSLTSSIPTPTTPLSAQSMVPSTPRRREIGQRASQLSLRNEPTTTSAQLLRLKRSLPVMKPLQSPARPATGGYPRPPSRAEMGTRSQSGLRPKTPVDRSRPNENIMPPGQGRNSRFPFLPAGASASQSHHVTAKSSRTFRRHESENTIDLRPNSRAVSRSTMRSPSPRKRAQEGFWQQLHKPRGAKHFGDGHELDAFDDLPTSATTEAKFMRQPVGSKTGLRNKLYQNVLPDRTNTPSPAPGSAARMDHLPHFARDTAASRIARETSLAQRVPSGPIAPLTSQRIAQLSTRMNIHSQPPQATVRSKKSLKRPPQLKPHLISNLNSGKETKMVNGMFYNPETFRWEGNENALNAFEAPVSTPSTSSLPSHLMREKDTGTPRPALITNINQAKGVQVVGGMVFDPQNMCWLKIGTPTGPKVDTDDPMAGFNALDDEDDPFKDIPDLDDNATETNEGQGRVSDIKDDWLVGEEFDVGPEFIRRQREEEGRWRRKVSNWQGPKRDLLSWRWAIREMVNAIE